MTFGADPFRSLVDGVLLGVTFVAIVDDDSDAVFFCLRVLVPYRWYVKGQIGSDYLGTCSQWTDTIPSLIHFILT